MTWNIAHRGFSGNYPENTLLAFQKGMEAGADGFELDIHLTKDGEMVVIHDETIDRTTNGTGFIKDYTYEELQPFDASAGFAGKYGINRIPTLRQYFELIQGNGKITNIELKNSIIWYDGMEEKAIALVKEFGMEDQVIFSSFNHCSMEKCKRLAPEIPCGLLVDSWLIRPGEYTKSRGMEYYHPHYLSLDPATVEEIHSHGIGIHTWTVNEEKDIRRMLDLGVHAIITNYPDRVNACKTK